MELVTNFNKVAKAIQEAKAKDDTTIKLIRVDFDFHYGSDYGGIELPKGADEFEVTYDNSSVTFNCLNGYKYSVPVIQEKYINIEGAVPEGEAEYEIVFNPNRLQQALATMGNENIRSAVRLKFYGKHSPAIIERVKEEESGYRLVLPLRL